MNAVTEFQYFNIQKRPRLEGHKTCRYAILSESSGALLGRIRWDGAWRQFCFFPEGDSLWSSGCLEDIQTFLASLMADRKAHHEAHEGREERKGERG